MKDLLLSNGFQPSYEKGFANGIAENGISVELISSDRTLAKELDHRIQINNLRGSQDPFSSTYAKAVNLILYADSRIRCCTSNWPIHSPNGALSVVGLCAVELMQSVLVIGKARQYWKRLEAHI
ncbi:MAG: hypothetical protein M3A44_08145 [Gammaproteobacteria bacterium]